MSEVDRTVRLAHLQQVLDSLGPYLEPLGFKKRPSSFEWKLSREDLVQEFVLFNRTIVLPDGSPATEVNPTIIISFRSIDRVSRKLEQLNDGKRRLISSLAGNLGLFRLDAKGTKEYHLRGSEDVHVVTKQLVHDTNNIVLPVFRRFQERGDLLDSERADDRITRGLNSYPIAFLALLYLGRGYEVARNYVLDRPGRFGSYGGADVVLSRLEQLDNES